LYKTNQQGSAIFSSMFKTGKAALIFKFLDEETSFWEDLQVIWMCPKVLFIKVLWKRVL
jgi:lycopene beta-cyclase